MTIPNPKFNIGDRVFHITRESDELIVINISFRLRNRAWIYTVSKSPGGDCEVYEDELTSSKIF